MTDIYDLKDRLNELLLKDRRTSTVSREFRNLSNNVDKVKLVQDLLIEYELIPIKCEPLKIEKSNDTSLKLRQQGNKCFALKKPTNLYKALELFNESIAYAECNTESLSLGYGNRSAAYFELKMYDACLENIKLAKENGFPNRSMEKLIKRELICNNEIQKQNHNNNNNNEDEIIYVPELSYPPHEKIPFIANCLDFIEDNKYGRYIKANIDLKAGKIVAIEKPFSTILIPTKKYICCANCLNENSLNLIPCLNCTSAMFCNEKCRTEAFNNFHQYECPIIDYLFKLFNKIPLCAVRVTIKAILAFKTSQKLISFTQEITNENDINAFTLNYNDNDTEEQKYYPIYTLATNEDKRSVGDLFTRAVIAAALNYYIRSYTSFKEYLKTIDEQNIFLHLLYKHLMIASTNFHNLDSTDLNVMQLEDYGTITDRSELGCGAYAFCSLLNHSCAPNIGRTSFGTYMVIYVLNLIKSGEQLFDNYGSHHCMEPKDKRQNSLSIQYHFHCQCIACNNNYPLFDNLITHKIDLLTSQILNENDYEKLSLCNKQFAFKCITKYSDFLTKYSHNYPCLVLCTIQEYLKMAFQIVLDKITFKMKLELQVSN